MYGRIGEVEVYHEVHGEGIPVVMIHGWGPDHRMMKGCMEPVFEKVKEKFKRIYFDLPGMGKTKNCYSIDSTDKMIGFIMKFIDNVIPGEDFILAGKSYGGFLARAVVKRCFHRIKGLFLLCPVAVLDAQKKKVPPFRVMEKDGEFLETLGDNERRSFESINVIQTEKVWSGYKKFIQPGLEIADNDYLENCLGKSEPFTENIDDTGMKYNFPTLMMTGRQDSCVGYSDLWKILEIYPRATYAVIDKAGHNLEIEQSVVFNNLAVEWLERVVSENKNDFS